MPLVKMLRFEVPMSSPQMMSMLGFLAVIALDTSLTREGPAQCADRRKGALTPLWILLRTAVRHNWDRQENYLRWQPLGSSVSSIRGPIPAAQSRTQYSAERP